MIDVTFASVSSAFSPRGSIGSSSRWNSTCAPTGSFSRGATLTITVLALRRPGCPLLEDLKTLLDDRQRLHKVALKTDEHVGRILIGTPHLLLGFRLSPIEDVL